MTVRISSSRDAIRRMRESMMNNAEHAALEFLESEHLKWSAVGAERSAAPVETVAELVGAGGKRIRPEFCISGYLAAGGDSGSDAVIAVAVALEFLHTCALIHDDVMDDSSWRRGVPTAHVRHAADHRTNQWQGESRRFGEGVAILAGDLALIYADDFMSEAGPVVAEAWAELRAELIIGQHLDLVAAARFTSDPSLSRIIARVKSGNYTISRPLVLGALTAGRADLQQIFLEYGQAIGEAFQLRDDLLDLISDTKILGKPARLDFEQHKMTLLLSLAIARDPEVAALVTTPDGSAERLRTTLLDSGICDEVETQISDLVATGTKVITDADLDPEWRDELIEMAHAVAYRDK